MAQRNSRDQAVVVAVAIGVPVVAQAVAATAGSGTGVVFQVGAVLGACGATWLATRRGLWWLVPAQPLIVVPIALAGGALSEPGGTSKTKLGTDAASVLQHSFPVAVAAVVAVVLVGVVKARRDRTNGSPGRPSARFGGPAPHRSGGGAHSTGGRRG